MFCENCGNEIKENEKFCTNCGAEVKLSPLPKNDLWLKIAIGSIALNLVLLIGLGVFYFHNENTRTITIQSDNIEQTCPECPNVCESETDTDKDGIVSQFDLNQYYGQKTEEFMEYYNKVVDRIKNTDIENCDKEALVNYVNAADDRFEKAADTFFPERNGNTLAYYGSSFPMVFSGFKQTFYEIELESYKHLIQATTMVDISDELKNLYK